MLRLILVRHAKSAWDDPSISDFDRPLAPRGRRAAVWIGETVRQNEWLPDRIICSSAVRTRQTLALAGLAEGDVDYEDAIYELRDENYVGLIRNCEAGRTLLLVGHNMAISETAAVLLDGDGVGDLSTGAIAVADFDVTAWSAIADRGGRLVAYHKPPKG